jgi:LysR family hca operon transcriptional activator
LRQLAYFVTVAHELSFTRAAERLHLTAPAVSQQIKALERRLGVQLLIRDTRHVALTAAGRSFAESSRRLLGEAELAVLNARQVAGVTEGRIVVAAVHDSETSFEPFLSDFHAAHPHVQVEMSARRHGELISALRAGSTWR